MRKGESIKFSAMSDLTGQMMRLEGVIIGEAKEIKQMQPEEFGGMENNEEVYLVERKDNFGNILRYVVHPEEILLNEKHDDECDCIVCRARVEKGGLDFDPTNDDEEFEEHERQVFRDVGIDKVKK